MKKNIDMETPERLRRNIHLQYERQTKLKLTLVINYLHGKKNQKNTLNTRNMDLKPENTFKKESQTLINCCFSLASFEESLILSVITSSEPRGVHPSSLKQ